MENVSGPRMEPKREREPGEQPWEMIMDKKHFKLWRRPIGGTHLYQYRGNGTPPRPLLRGDSSKINS